MATYTQDDINKAVFRVIASNGELGTCFLTHIDGENFFLLTAYHVVESVSEHDDVQIEIESQMYPAKVVKPFPEYDVAILHAEHLPLMVKPLVLSSDIQQNTPFITYGFPGNAENPVYRGKINTPVKKSTSYGITFDITQNIHLSGLSGAPVYNEQYEVVGIMITHDRRQLQSGTISPCKAFKNLLNYSVKRDSMTCYVILSDAERQLPDDSFGRLKIVAEDAIRNLGSKPIDLVLIHATDAFLSEDAYAQTIRNLCRAEIALFDLTNYEPAIMFLLGIRSVVRKGVTIASVGGNFSIGDVIDLPFNIKEVNLVSHSKKQFDENIRNRTLHPDNLLRERIKQGIKEYQSPQYSDLPAFDAIRHLPEGHRTFIDYKDSILILCSYSPSYQERNWMRYVKNDFERQRFGDDSGEFNVRRILDFTSEGRLISHMIYENIRRMDLCIVDWTDWRPNVFFEMGIRLSVRDSGTYIIAEDKHIDLVEKIVANEPDEDLLKFLGKSGDMGLIKRIRSCQEQCQALIRFFAPNIYKCQPGQREPYEQILREHGSIQENVAYYQQRQYAQSSDTFDYITTFIDLTVESSSTPVYAELLASAELYDVDESKGIPSVLYPGNEELRKQAESATIERFWATWYYITNRYKLDEIEQDENLLEAYWDVRNKLETFMNDVFKDISKPAVRPIVKTSFKDTDDLIKTVTNFKQSARAKRESKNLDGAIENLNNAIRLLNDYPDQTHPKIQKELSDCYGSLGGIYRRQNNLIQAEKMYEMGLRYEVNDSYNLGNYRVLSIINNPASFGELQTNLAQDRLELRKQTTGDRKNQWWAWADMGLFALLNSDLLEAKSAYEMFNNTGARESDYNSTIDVLKELYEAITVVDKTVADLIQQAIYYLQDEKERKKATT